MNKLAIFAISALIILGGFSWFAAKNSFIQYKAEYQQQVNQQDLGFTLAIGEVQIYNKTGQAHSEELTLTFNSLVEKPSVSFTNTKVQFDPNTFKDEVIQITAITGDSLRLMLPVEKPQQALKQMISTLTKLTHNAHSKQQGLNNSKEAIVAIQQSTMINIYITLTANGEPVQEHVINQQQLTPTDNGAPLSWQLLTLMEQWLQLSADNFPESLIQ